MPLAGPQVRNADECDTVSLFFNDDGWSKQAIIPEFVVKVKTRHWGRQLNHEILRMRWPVNSIRVRKHLPQDYSKG